jgi:hypothetical protein
MSEVWFELNKEAQKQGKVDFLTWSQAKREGVDPDSLFEKRQEAKKRHEQKSREYAEYVYGGNKTIDRSGIVRHTEPSFGERLEKLEKQIKRQALEIKALKKGKS